MKHPHKYRAIATIYAGIRYDSKAEAKHAEGLDARKLAGEIRWWHPKPGTFRLGCPENVYRPDFMVFGHQGEWIEEVKGVLTAKAKKDLTLWEHYGPCVLLVYTRKSITKITPDRLAVAG